MQQSGEDRREDWAPSRSSAAQGRAAGRGFWEKGSCRRKEDVGCGSCSTRNFIKAEIQAQGARYHFGIKRVIYQLTYIPRLVYLYIVESTA